MAVWVLILVWGLRLSGWTDPSGRGSSRVAGAPRARFLRLWGGDAPSGESSAHPVSVASGTLGRGGSHRHLAGSRNSLYVLGSVGAVLRGSGTARGWWSSPGRRGSSCCGPALGLSSCWAGVGFTGFGSEGAEVGPPRASGRTCGAAGDALGVLHCCAASVGRSRRLWASPRGLLGRQGRGVWGNPRGPLTALRLGAEPSTLRACLHAWFPHSGGPLFSLHPGASRCRSVYRVPVILG